MNVTRWFQTVVNQPAAKEVLGEVKLAEKVAAFNRELFLIKSITSHHASQQSILLVSGMCYDDGI